MCFRPAEVQLDKRCPICSSSNLPDAELCSACGSPLPEEELMDFAQLAGEKMPGAFGDSGVAGGGFQPRIPTSPQAPPAPPAPAPPAPPTATG